MRRTKLRSLDKRKQMPVRAKMEIKAFFWVLVVVVVVVAVDWDDDDDVLLLSSLIIIIPEANDLIVATT